MRWFSEASSHHPFGNSGEPGTVARQAGWRRTLMAVTDAARLMDMECGTRNLPPSDGDCPAGGVGWNRTRSRGRECRSCGPAGL